MPREKMWFRRFLACAVIVGFFCALGSIYLIVEHASGKRRLAAARGMLEASGTLLPLDRLVGSNEPEVVRNGEKLLEVLKEFGTKAKVSSFLMNGPETMAMESPGIARPVVGRAVPILQPEKGDSSPTWPELRSLYDETASIRAEVAALLQNPVGLDHDQRSLKPRYDLGGVQKYGALLRTGALLEIQGGNLRKAVEDLRETKKMAELMGSSKTIVRQTLEIGMWHFGIHGVVWEMLQSPRLTEADLADLQVMLSQGNFVAETIRAMKVELAIGPDIYAAVGKQKPGEFSWSILSTPGPGWLVPVRNALWPYAWKDGDLARSFDFWRRAIPIAEKLSLSRDWEATKAGFPPDVPASEYDQWRFPFSTESWGFSSVKTMLQNAVKGEARRQLALAAVGLARYKIAHGRYPEALSDLAPAILPEVPHDWFDGTPLKYRVLPDGKYLLYSVGEDGVDDGGDAAAKDGKKTNSTNGRDLVWPVAVSH